MQKPKLDVFVAFLTFGGNGGVSTIIPSHSDWLAETALKAKSDPRVGRFEWGRFGDIPLDVERNKIVQYAKSKGFDVVVMLDSDNFVDKYVGADSRAKPFWDSSFDFLYERTLKGIPTVVCCPYCGPPPDDVKGGMENVYVFYFEGMETPEESGPRPAIQLTAYTREHASMMRGIEPIGAGPTGAIMYSMDSFDLFPPITPKEKVLEMYKDGELTSERAIQLLSRQGWFFYETNHDRTRKESTEDVTNTREIQLAGLVKYGQPIVFCNWDAWAGHWKPKCVGKPRSVYIESVSEMFQETVRSNIRVDSTAADVDYTENLGDFKYEGPILTEQPAESPSTQVLFKHKLDLKFPKDTLERIGDHIRQDESVLAVGADSEQVAFACAADDKTVMAFFTSDQTKAFSTKGMLSKTDGIENLDDGAFDVLFLCDFGDDARKIIHCADWNKPPAIFAFRDRIPQGALSDGVLEVFGRKFDAYDSPYARGLVELQSVTPG